MAEYSVLMQAAVQAGCVCLQDEPMASHTSFQVGGPAKLFIEVASKAALAQLLQVAQQENIPTFILGNGTNLLVADTGFDGAVLHIGGGFDKITLNGACEIECDAGVKLSKVCNFALEHSLSGLEFAWGIPGSVGGAAYMNAGAYDSEMKNILHSCCHIDRQGNEGTFEGDELKLGYRKSVYTGSDLVITSMKLRLNPGDKAEIRARMDDIFARRKEKQPLEYPSAGSVFKRPPGQFAGALIQQCGLKGYTVGGAMVSEKHAGFIVNVGGATCSDVKQVIEHIQQQVFLHTSVKLETEIISLG